MSPSNNPGPPPVERSAAAPDGNNSQLVPMQNYQVIVGTLKANNSAEAKAIKAMFGGNKQLMDRFLAVAFSLLAADSDLLRKATPMSIVEAIKKAASLGLEPMTDDAAIVRYGDKATLLPMYKGYLKRIRNSGLMRAVDVGTVYTNDEFDYGANEKGGWFAHHPARARKDPETGENLTSRGDYMGFYAYAVDLTGFTYFRYMDVDQINHVRDTFGRTESKDGRPLPWRTSYEQMAIKTVLRLLQKLLPQEAVGREFVELEKQNDDAIVEMSHKVDDAMEEVRNLALRAVSQAPQLTEGQAVAENGTNPNAADEPGAPEDEPVVVAEPLSVDLDTDEPEQLPSTLNELAPDPGADPNVAAAMALNDEQARLREFRQRAR